MGKSTVKGNLNINETAVNDGTLKTILMASDHYHDDVMKKGIESYIKRYEDKQLFIYDFRITDYDEAWDLKGGKDSIILSPVDLTDSNFSLRLVTQSLICLTEPVSTIPTLWYTSPPTSSIWVLLAKNQRRRVAPFT